MKNKTLFLLLLFLFIGCEKDKPEQEIKYIPQELKDYMYFKTGTWWVYEEETTHERDSVIVYYDADSLVTFDGSNGSNNGTFEFFKSLCHSFFDHYNYYYLCNTTWTENERTPVFRDKTKPGDYVGQTILMFNKFVIGNKLYPLTVNCELILTAKYDSISIASQYFYNVVKFLDTRNSTEGLDSTNFFISKHIGIIRKEIFFNNQKWNLVNYNIIQ